MFVYELSGCGFDSRCSHLDSTFDLLGFKNGLHFDLIVVSNPELLMLFRTSSHIGLPYTDKNSGKKVKPIIVKFRSWKARQRFYKGRPRHYADSSKKPGFTVSVDLTKRRYLLLTKAKGLIKGNSNIKYVYSDINCSLALRFKDYSFKYLNSERELLSLLNV